MSHRRCDSGECEDCQLEQEEYLYQQAQEESYRAAQWRYDSEVEAFVNGGSKESFLDFLFHWYQNDTLVILEVLKEAERAKKEKIQTVLPGDNLDGCQV